MAPPRICVPQLPKRRGKLETLMETLSATYNSKRSDLESVSGHEVQCAGAIRVRMLLRHHRLKPVFTGVRPHCQHQQAAHDAVHGGRRARRFSRGPHPHFLRHLHQVRIIRFNPPTLFCSDPRNVVATSAPAAAPPSGSHCHLHQPGRVAFCLLRRDKQSTQGAVHEVCSS